MSRLSLSAVRCGKIQRLFRKIGDHEISKINHFDGDVQSTGNDGKMSIDDSVVGRIAPIREMGTAYRFEKNELRRSVDLSHASGDGIGGDDPHMRKYVISFTKRNQIHHCDIRKTVNECIENS